MKPLFLLSMVLLLTACASEQIVSLDSKLAHEGFSEGESVRAIDRLSIRSWQYIDDNNILIQSKDEAHLVRFILPCPALQMASDLRFQGSSGKLQSMDKILIGKSICRIHDIIQLNVTQP